MTGEKPASGRLVALLREIYTEEEAFKYLTLPQPMFDGAIALDMIASGRMEDLIEALQRMQDGVYV